MLATVSLGWAVLQFGRMLLSPLLPAIITDLAITEATAGIVLAAFQVVYAVTQYPSGEFSDQWTRATLIVPAFTVLVVGFSLFDVVGGLGMFVLAAVVTGVGKGLFSIPSRALLSDLFTTNRGRALGIYAAGTDIGGIAAAGVATVTVTYASWRTPFLPVAIVLGVLTICYMIMNRESYTIERTTLDIGGTVGRLVQHPRQRETLTAFALFYFMVGGVINFYPIYLTRTKDFSAELASLTFALIFIVGLVIKPSAGTLGDRFSRIGIAISGLLIAAVALTAVTFVSTPIYIWIVTSVLAIGYKTGFPLADAIILDGAPNDDMGADLGAARALFLGANAVGPAYVGIVATYGSYEIAFGGLAVCLLLAAGLLARQRIKPPTKTQFD
ncbi:MFS transporter [Haloquadratum walsbyi]|uniref:Arabinose efflux permease n=1 Tax=Haloquadratum walsbyi J07HQW2 TaxID=1238425 RepID=U1NIA5_9EURY|nr:MFS transporter [Haloquadratum walsbyi]ERG96905.1 MAG: arabinose efflux permease [Haloquadratum walsbyi J07HQW2]